MLSVFMLVVAAAAQQAPDCKDPQTQSDMNICSGRAYRAADAAMVVQYNLVAARMKKMDLNLDQTYDDRPGYFAAFLDSQRAWLKFRDAACVVEGYYARGGTMEPLLVNTCFEELTKQRTEQLQSLDKLFNE